MSIPSPPTDNLYKFLAVSGVVLIVACMYQTAINKEDLLEDWVRHSNEQKAESWARSLELFATGKPDARDMALLLIEQAKTAFSDESKQIKSHYEFRNAELKRRKEIFDFGVNVGSVMGAVGFFLWWFRVQRFQDSQLRTDAIKAAKGL